MASSFSWNASFCVFDDFHDTNSWIAIFAFLWATFAGCRLDTLIILGLFCLFKWPTLDRREIPVEVLWLLERILGNQTCFLAFRIIPSWTLTWLQSRSLRQLMPFTNHAISLRIPPLHWNHNSTLLLKTNSSPFHSFNTFITLHNSHSFSNYHMS